MTTEEILKDLEWSTPEYIVKKHEPTELKKAIEIGRQKIWDNEQSYIQRRREEGFDYKTAKKSGQRMFEKKRDRYNKKANQIENLLSGKPSESMIKTMRSKIVSIVKKHKFPVQKTHTTRIRGWTETSTGIRVSAEPSYHPYEYVSVEYYIRSDFGSPSSERMETARQQLEIIRKEAEALGYNVKVVDRGLEIRP